MVPSLPRNPAGDLSRIQGSEKFVAQIVQDTMQNIGKASPQILSLKWTHALTYGTLDLVGVPGEDDTGVQRGVLGGELTVVMSSAPAGSSSPQKQREGGWKLDSFSEHEIWIGISQFWYKTCLFYFTGNRSTVSMCTWPKRNSTPFDIRQFSDHFPRMKGDLVSYDCGKSICLVQLLVMQKT